MSEILPDRPALGESAKRVRDDIAERKRKRSVELVTTGAFMTRTTLRKLGAHISTGDLDSPAADRLQPGSWVRVLSLDRAWYTAAVLSVLDGARALVHYPGWDHGFDEWISVESRRLMYRGKVLHDDDMAEYCRQMALLDAEQEEAARGFDLAEEVRLAMGVAAEAGIEGSSGEAARKRGRPTGSHNRRHVGVVKRRDRPQKKKKAVARKKAKVETEPKTESEPDPKPEPEPEAKSEDPAPQFVVPEELRVARIRQLQKITNPYAFPQQQQQHIDRDLDLDTDSDPSPSKPTPRSKKATEVKEQQRGGEKEEEEEEDAGDAVWRMLSNSDYVTTGAFTTRRTIKCLAHHGSTGGIIQSHHGVYPGQPVEVMNANRRWYPGRVLSYEDKKFLVHFVGWGHEQNEWVAQDSKRLRKVEIKGESEEDARRACAALVRENNAYVDGVERKRGEIRRKAEERRVARARKKAGGNDGAAVAAESPSQTHERVQAAAAAAAAAAQEQREQEEQAEAGEHASDASDIDPDVLPIAVDQGYAPVPQMARVKDYVQFYRHGMRVAVRDRDMSWWRGSITEIKTFRLRVHYAGFSRSWDEWIEMNTQRLLVEEASLLDTTEGSESSQAPAQAQQEQEPPQHDPQQQQQRPAKRLGRPPKAESQPAPLTLQLALRRLAQRQTAAVTTPASLVDLQAKGDSSAFLLPRSHMTLKDYSVLLQTGDKVEIRGRDLQWYASTIINVKHGRIRVCYDGLADEHNQWIAFNSERIRVLSATAEADGRLARLADEQGGWRRRRRRQVERARELRKRRQRVAHASLVRLAESMEYVAGSSSDDDDDAMPLVLRMLEGGSDAADAMPLAERLQLGRRLAAEQAARAQQARAAADSQTWFVYCNSCGVVIRTFRYYCTACEHPSDGLDYRSFDLCLGCFSQAAATASASADGSAGVLGHRHARTHFARAPIGEAAEIVAFTERLLAQCHAEADADADADAGLVADVLTAYEQDSLDEAYDAEAHVADGGGGGVAMWSVLAAGLHGTATHTADAVARPAASRIGGYAAGLPRCAFCGSADAAQAAALGGFAAGRPFLMPAARAAVDDDDDSGGSSGSSDSNSGSDGTNGRGPQQQRRQQRFWAHDACARASPEVLVSADGRWYNVAAALRRGRLLSCAGCRRRGATVGCFHARCQRSYHVGCTLMDAAALCAGQLFWCPRHAQSSGDAHIVDTAAEPPQCAACERRLTRDLMWMECLECQPKPRPFSVCLACYESRDALATHPHKKRCFREHVAAADSTAAASAADASANAEPARRGRRRGRPLGGKSCHYCCTRATRRWRRGYGGAVMCEDCFQAAHGGAARPLDVLEEERDAGADPAGAGAGAVELVALNPFGSRRAPLPDDYEQRIYFTRDTCASTAADAGAADATATSGSSTAAAMAGLGAQLPAAAPSHQPLGALSSYGPTDAMLFTLPVDSTYYDIPGRAPRWASHSGSDYHGTWLPQTVRRALLRYTRPGDRVLSNFLGRGTDAIESFLLSRKCVGVDINPAAVALAQRNCSFAMAPGMDVAFRPDIVQADARSLGDAPWPGAELFSEPESFDHVLSHPPYKDCVLYSAGIPGDLSRFPGPDDFAREMLKVIRHSWRLLKPGRHLTLGIGDNRADCFYVPVSFALIRNYIDQGFELDELVVKRQRYCQAFGLGTYLCVQFDFLMFTHEFIAELRKVVPRQAVDRMLLPAAHYVADPALGFHKESSSISPPSADFHVAVAERVLRQVPPSPIERKSVVMGSVWTFERHATHAFPLLCMSRMVERFGRDASNWEQITLVLDHHPLHAGTRRQPPPTPPAAPTNRISPEEHPECSSDPESSAMPVDNGTHAGAYEQERQRQIRQNREQLLHLGLLSDLGDDSTDTAHYRKLLAMPHGPQTRTLPLSLIVVPHVPNTSFTLAHISGYRRALIQLTHDAAARLSPSGLLVLGVQDVRDERGKLWPLGMLVLEDVQKAVGPIRLRLKEFIVAVENGHARRRDDVVSRDSFVEERCVVGDHSPDIHLPIVHVYYLVFMKLK